MTIRISKRKVKNIVGDILRHGLLLLLAVIWLIPILWLLVSAFDKGSGLTYSRFFPEEWTLQHFIDIFTVPEPNVVNFPQWFLNTLIVATFTCIISTLFILGVSYSISKTRFKGRKFLMNMSMIIGLFPGFLSMICVYFILQTFGILASASDPDRVTKGLFSLILVYSASSGTGYLVAKGFFDTIPNSLIEAAKVDGASQMRIFLKIIIPLSKPIIVYTIITSFLGPWCDFIFARIILPTGVIDCYTVSIGLFRMLDRSLVNQYFTQFCAGAFIISVPVSLLFIATQKFYVEGITGGSVKG